MRAELQKCNEIETSNCRICEGRATIVPVLSKEASCMSHHFLRTAVDQARIGQQSRAETHASVRLCRGCKQVETGG